jgi:hypothetical protein
VQSGKLYSGCSRVSAKDAKAVSITVVKLETWENTLKIRAVKLEAQADKLRTREAEYKDLQAAV